MSKPTPFDSEINIDPGVRDWMRAIGFVHESEIQHATSTTPRSRQRWRGLRGTLFGNERWFKLSDVEAYLNARMDEANDQAEASATFL